MTPQDIKDRVGAACQQLVGRSYGYATGATRQTFVEALIELWKTNPERVEFLLSTYEDLAAEATKGAA